MLHYPSFAFYIIILVFFLIFAAVSFANFSYAYDIPTEDTNKPENISKAAVKYLYTINIIMGILFIILLIYGSYLLLTKYKTSAEKYYLQLSEVDERQKDILLKNTVSTNNALTKAFNNAIARLKAKDEGEDPMASPDPIIRLTPDSGKIQKLVINAGKDAQGKTIFKYLNLPTTKDGEIIGVLVKPEAESNGNWKKVSFDIETQKCYNLQSNKDKKPGNAMIMTEDPRARFGTGIPSETSALTTYGAAPGLLPLLPGAGVGNTCDINGCYNNQCVSIRHPEYITNSCGPVRRDGSCGTIYSTPYNLGEVRYK
jgi:hypothetical protein